MNVLIIEDEKPNVEILTRALSRINPAINVSGPITSISAGVKYLRENPAPDLILSDVCLEDGNSFEIFKQVEVKSPLVFVTAYDEYAREAFRAHGLRYLTKPINFDELREVVEFVMHNFQKGEPRRRFLVASGDGIATIRVEDVNVLVSFKGGTKIILGNGARHIVAQQLSKLELELDAQEFVRVSRSILVRIDKITHLLRDGKELAAIRVEGSDEEIPVSRNRLGYLRQVLDC